jgi:hypothetical protein
LGGSRSLAVIAAAAELVAPIIAIRSFYPASGLSLVIGGRSTLSRNSQRREPEKNSFVMPYFRVAQSTTFWLYPRAFRSG